MRMFARDAAFYRRHLRRAALERTDDFLHQSPPRAHQHQVANLGRLFQGGAGRIRTVYRRRGGEPGKRLHAMFCSETHHLGELDGGAHAWLPSAVARNWGTMLLSPWISAMTLSISSMNSCADTVL